jgi:hypothetical protein
VFESPKGMIFGGDAELDEFAASIKDTLAANVKVQAAQYLFMTWLISANALNSDGRLRPNIHKSKSNHRLG